MIVEHLTAAVATFTVDLTANSVPLVPGWAAFAAPGDAVNFFFTPRDHIKIKTVSLAFPCAFCSVNVGGVPLRIDFLWRDDILGAYAIDEIHGGTGGAEGQFGIPVENTEIPVGAVIYYPPLAGGGVKMALIGRAFGSVCMANVPVELDELEFAIYAYCKLEHTLPMIA